MFVKLNKQFDNITFTKGQEAISYGGIISYSYLDGVNSNLYEVIPEKYRPAFSLSVMEVIGEVPPHTDSDAKTVVNFYLRTGNYRTVFFKGESSSHQIDNQTNGRLFDRNGLVEAGSFIAREGDAFCLDVDKIHAVDSLGENPNSRIAVCLSTGDYKFDDVCDMLYRTGLLN